MKHRHGLHSLRARLNLLIIGIILAVAAGLVSISYYVFCQKVDDTYNTRISRAASACASNMPSEMLIYLWQLISSDEYQELRTQAMAEDNEQLLTDWLASQPSWYMLDYARNADGETAAAGDTGDAENGEDSGDHENAGQGDASESMTTEEAAEYWNMLEDYQSIIESLKGIKEYLSVDSAYYQIDVNGETYNIADPDEDIFYVGTKETYIEAFEGYEDNAAIPPTVYHSDYGWLCTAVEPVIDSEGNAVCIAGVDINMTDIMYERHSFLLNSLLFVLLLTALGIVISMHLFNRIAVRPLHRLTEAATSFGSGEEGYSKDDIVDLNIRSTDEIRELYTEIRSMQGRIVDYTDNITRITAEKERVSTELRTASGIQEAMLPHIFPPFPNRQEFELYASMDPAKEVGGDFYDFFLIDDNHLALLIADVSDKGVPAALFMMSSKILINYRTQLGGSPSEILAAVNAQLCNMNKTRMFVTVWLGIIDLRSGEMVCSNAGHEYPFIRAADGKYRVLKDKHGMVVGALKRARFTDYLIKLQPGDMIFVYTDGVPEANNEAGEFYGMDRLENALNHMSDTGPEEVIHHIRSDVDSFMGEAIQFDDLTMLAMKYNGSVTTSSEDNNVSEEKPDDNENSEK